MYRKAPCEMLRNQTFHETLIPLLVEGIGAKSYLELGTHLNETISKVRCERRYGVDLKAVACPGAQMFQMSTWKFIQDVAPTIAPFDVVFIDADHSAEAVEKDFNGIWPHVSKEGLILLHDTNPETVKDTEPGLCGDAWRFIYGKENVLESVTLPYSPGLTIVRKRLWWGPSHE
jgi:Methyltransferase domain